MIKKLRITVEGKAYDVQVEILGDEGAMAPIVRPIAPVATSAALGAPIAAAAAPVAPKPIAAASQLGDIPSPLAGKVVSIDCAVGATVSVGQKVITLEAMKMNTIVSAPVAGVIKAVKVNPGDAVEEGQILLTIE